MKICVGDVLITRGLISKLLSTVEVVEIERGGCASVKILCTVNHSRHKIGEIRSFGRSVIKNSTKMTKKEAKIYKLLYA